MRQIIDGSYYEKQILSKEVEDRKTRNILVLINNLKQCTTTLRLPYVVRNDYTTH